MIVNIVSCSGGKDSTALYLWAIEQFGKDGFKAVMADTGHEHPVTIDYAKKLHIVTGGPKVEIVAPDFADRLEKKGLPISGYGMKDLCVWKGRVPSSKAQFCTEHLKLEPIRKWLKSFRTDDMEIIMFTGIRAGESERRSKMTETEWSDYYDCEQRRPLLKWSEDEVFKKLNEHGISSNPLYEMGYSRVGCFPCIHARKSELSKLPSWAWDRIEDIERSVGRSWFSAGTVPGVHVPTIQDAKEWAKTSRGGRQFDMFAEDEKDPPSCMSAWGACE